MSSSGFTITIPTYNGHRYLRAAVESALSCRGVDRVLISDDASTCEKSKNLLADLESEIPELDIVRHQTNLGMVGNWNFCATSVKTPYFVILHQDDQIGANYAEKMRALMQAHPEAGLAVCEPETLDSAGHAYVDHRFEIKRKRLANLLPDGQGVVPPRDAVRLLLRGSVFCCPAVAFRREAFEKLGPFDPAFGMVQDWEYWLRASLAGVSIAYTAEHLYRYRVHEENATAGHRRSLRKYKERKALLERAFSESVAQGHCFRNEWTSFRTTLDHVLIWDIADDLALGQKEDAKTKLVEGPQLMPELERNLKFRLIRAACWGGKPVGKMAKWIGRRLAH